MNLLVPRACCGETPAIRRAGSLSSPPPPGDAVDEAGNKGDDAEERYGQEHENFPGAELHIDVESRQNAKAPLPIYGVSSPAGARRMIYHLHPDYPELFPDPEGADPEGLVAVGGDLSAPPFAGGLRRPGFSRGTGKGSLCSGGPPIPGASCFLKNSVSRIPSVRKYASAAFP